MTIHWCGTGLSAIPGLRSLIHSGADVVVWNRTIEKAQEQVGDIQKDIRTFDLDALTAATNAGDIIVSMLPATWHVPLAEMGLSKGANFVSSSYIAPEMRDLDSAFKQAGLASVNEVGLDPGIDHLMAHYLVDNYKNSPAYNTENELSFISYCGGVPKIPNKFLYKFSWSPLGVLNALRSPSKSIRDFKELDVARPWDAISSYTAPLPQSEDFEVYPNRDSIPFIADYQFGDDWKIKEFVRGTLRLGGWQGAWSGVFKEIETLQGASGDARMKEMSDQFWAENAYEEGEPDRVIMCVGLKAERDGETVYNKTYAMDAWGNEQGSAMARLVSMTLALAVKGVASGEFASGVQAAPNNLKIVNQWLEEVAKTAQHVELVDHLK
jgi:saccharopine dehydrogenase-like NADP-dependent oxidoreductase